MRSISVLSIFLFVFNCAALSKSHDIETPRQAQCAVNDSLDNAVWISSPSIEFHSGVKYKGDYLLCGKAYISFKNDGSFSVTVLDNYYEPALFEKMRARFQERSYGRPEF